MCKSSSRKNAINYLKTVSWYENINNNVSIKRRIAVEINSPFRLGPDPNEEEKYLFIVNVNRISEFFDQQESAIWYKYNSGATSPTKTTLEMCEDKIPGSSIYFKHPIWKLLERFPTHEDLKIFYSALPKKNLEFLLRKLPMDLTQDNAGEVWEKWDGKFQLFMLINFLDFIGFVVYTYYKSLYKFQFEKTKNIHIFLTQNVQFILDNFRWCGVYLLDFLFLHIRQPNQDNNTDWINFVASDEIRQTIDRIRKMKRFIPMQKSMDDFKTQFTDACSLD